MINFSIAILLTVSNKSVFLFYLGGRFRSLALIFFQIQIKNCKQTLFPISPPPDKWNFLRQRSERFLSSSETPSSRGPRLSVFYCFILGSRAWCFLLISTTGLSNLEVNCALIFQERAGASGQPIVLSVEPGGRDPCSPGLLGAQQWCAGLQLPGPSRTEISSVLQSAAHIINASSP